jgi:DNA-directed RNA polymerase specialized sigma24 family protein
MPFDLSDEQADALASLESALERLEQTDPRLSRMVECRFFGDMSIADTATALNLSPATVKRDWTLARAWLFREMQQ